MKEIEHKIALVTGSTTGIGEAIARRFVAEGARVMLHGKAEEESAGARLIAELREQHLGAQVAFRAADLAEPDECAKLVAQTIEHFGGLDILVNNAAVVTRSNLETTDAATFDRTLAINTRAPLLLAQATLAQFRKNGRGAVLNIGSINAYCGEPNLLAYSISKSGLMALSRNLADAYATENIRVNHLNLGWVLTQNEYELKRREGMPVDWPQTLPPVFAPSGRILKPEEIAHFALAFVSDGGGPISGCVVELEQYPVIGRNPNKED